MNGLNNWKLFFLFLRSVQATGDGLVKGLTTQPAKFTVNAVKPGLHDNGKLTIGVKSGNTSPEVTIVDAGSGTYEVAYIPTKPDDFHVSICYMEKHIPGSPFRATILKQPDSSKCIAHGDCLSPDAKIDHSEPVDVTVATKDAGHGKLHATATGPDENPIEVFLNEKHGG